MGETRKLEQHIAVFGESGSGKTVLLSSFFGAAQEASFIKNSLFHVLADDAGQGSRLQRDYLGMRNSATLPAATRHFSTSYSFTLKPQRVRQQRTRSPLDAVKLVWHDYPGEWFDSGVSGPTEAQRRIDGFRALLRSDVGLILIDGQRLLDNEGVEERYLKSVLGNFRNGLLSLRDDLLVDGKPLLRFPRIWVFALSKADLHPGRDAYWFRDLLVEKACDEIDELRTVLRSMIDEGAALDIGEDFMLLSSARFDPERIDVSDRVGIDLIFALSLILPFERHAKWVNALQLPGRVAEALVGDAGARVAAVLAGLPWVPGKLAPLFGPVAARVLETAAELAGERLKSANASARARHDDMRAILTGFKSDLESGEAQQVLIRSRR